MKTYDRLSVLMVEDDPVFSRLVEAMLGTLPGPTFVLTHAGRLEEAIGLVGQVVPDAALLDLTLPDSSGLVTFERLRQAAPRLCVVLMTGLDDEQSAIDAVRLGAQDYLVKGNLTGPAIRRALLHGIERSRLEVQRDHLIAELQEALSKVRTLDGMLPMCSGCKKIRDDQGYWDGVEHYISQRTGAKFSHGMCPDCVRVYFPEAEGDPAP